MMPPHDSSPLTNTLSPHARAVNGVAVASFFFFSSLVGKRLSELRCLCRLGNRRWFCPYPREEGRERRAQGNFCPCKRATEPDATAVNEVGDRCDYLVISAGRFAYELYKFQQGTFVTECHCSRFPLRKNFEQALYQTRFLPLPER